MKRSNCLIYSLALLLLLPCKFALCQRISSFELSNKLSILNNRLFLEFPVVAANVIRSAGIMLADPNQEQETRIILDIDKMRLVFYAQELYKFGSGNFYSQVINDKNEIKSKHEILANKKGLLSIQCTPTTFDSTKNAILINSLLVKTKDNAVVRIDSYINPIAFKNKDEFIALTKRVFATLQNGPRINNKKQRKETVNIFGTKKSFRLFIPENYAVTVDKKYDFQVIHFHKYAEYGDTSRVDLMVYTGYFPWADYEHYGFGIKSAKNVAGVFLDQKVSWMTFYDAQKNIFLKEQKIPSDKIADGLIVHIGMVSDNIASINEQTSIVEAIKLK
jgi:hypothetical protein